MTIDRPLFELNEPIWNGKRVADLTDEELVDASFTINKMFDDNTAKQNDPKFAKKYKSIPQLNPAFIKLKEVIANEVTKRQV